MSLQSVTHENLKNVEKNLNNNIIDTAQNLNNNIIGTAQNLQNQILHLFNKNKKKIDFLKSISVGNIFNININKGNNKTIKGQHKILEILHNSEFCIEFKILWITNTGNTEVYHLYSWDSNYNLKLSVLGNSRILYIVHYSSVDVDLESNKYKSIGYFYKYSDEYKKNIKYSFNIDNDNQ